VHVTLALLAVVFALAPPADAKCCSLTTPPAPDGLAAGEEWVAQLELQGDPWPAEHPPLTLVAWSLSERRHMSFPARPTSARRVYVARVEFPTPGKWRYTVTLGGFSGSAAAPVRTISVAARGPRIDANWAIAVSAAALVLASMLIRRRTLALRAREA
jgi:hypothetical protein